jgi:hypothetical protein
MAQQEPASLARMLIARHGLRASAVAEEHVNQARTAGDTASHERWVAVQAAVNELRRTAPRAAAARVA